MSLERELIDAIEANTAAHKKSAKKLDELIDQLEDFHKEIQPVLEALGSSGGGAAVAQSILSSLAAKLTGGK